MDNTKFFLLLILFLNTNCLFSAAPEHMRSDKKKQAAEQHEAAVAQLAARDVSQLRDDELTPEELKKRNRKRKRRKKGKKRKKKKTDNATRGETPQEMVEEFDRSGGCNINGMKMVNVADVLAGKVPKYARAKKKKDDPVLKELTQFLKTNNLKKNSHRAVIKAIGKHKYKEELTHLLWSINHQHCLFKRIQQAFEIYQFNETYVDYKRLWGIRPTSEMTAVGIMIPTEKMGLFTDVCNLQYLRSASPDLQLNEEDRCLIARYYTSSDEYQQAIAKQLIAKFEGRQTYEYCVNLHDSLLEYALFVLGVLNNCSEQNPYAFCFHFCSYGLRAFLSSLLPLYVQGYSFDGRVPFTYHELRNLKDRVRDLANANQDRMSAAGATLSFPYLRIFAAWYQRNEKALSRVYNAVVTQLNRLLEVQSYKHIFTHLPERLDDTPSDGLLMQQINEILQESQQPAFLWPRPPWGEGRREMGWMFAEQIAEQEQVQQERQFEQQKRERERAQKRRAYSKTIQYEKRRRKKAEAEAQRVREEQENDLAGQKIADFIDLRGRVYLHSARMNNSHNNKTSFTVPDYQGRLETFCYNLGELTSCDLEQTLCSFVWDVSDLYPPYTDDVKLVRSKKTVSVSKSGRAYVYVYPIQFTAIHDAQGTVVAEPAQGNIFGDVCFEERVKRWKDQPAQDFEIVAEYQDRYSVFFRGLNLDRDEMTRRLFLHHRLPQQLVPYFNNYSIKTRAQNSNGQIVEVYSLVCRIIYPDFGGYQDGVWQVAINRDQDMCYHCCFTPRPRDHVLAEFMKQGYFAFQDEQ